MHGNNRFLNKKYMAEEKKKSWGNTVLGFFFEVDSESTKENPPPIPKTPVTPVVPVLSSQPVVVATPSSAKVSEKYAQLFADLLEENNLPGPDFFEFMQALQKMESKTGITEAMKYELVFSSFVAMGGNEVAQELIVQANHYLAVLNQDKVEFTQTVNQNIEQKVGSLKTQVTQLEESSRSAEEQIKVLQTQIAQNQQKQTELKTAIDQQSEKLMNDQSEYESTHAHIVGKIETYKEKITINLINSKS